MTRMMSKQAEVLLRKTQELERSNEVRDDGVLSISTLCRDCLPPYKNVTDINCDCSEDDIYVR